MSKRMFTSAEVAKVETALAEVAELRKQGN